MTEWYILAGGADVRAHPQAGWKHHLPCGIDPDIFLHKNGIGAVGHRCPGKDPYGVSRLPSFCWRTRLHASTYRKTLFTVRRQVSAVHGITVDCGIGEWRQRQRRGNITREYPA